MNLSALIVRDKKKSAQSSAALYCHSACQMKLTRKYNPEHLIILQDSLLHLHWVATSIGVIGKLKKKKMKIVAYKWNVQKKSLYKQAELLFLTAYCSS